MAVSPKAEFLIDDSRQLSFEQVLTLEWAATFTPNEKANLNFGRTRAAIWIRFSLVDHSQRQWYLLLDTLLEDEFALYMVPAGTQADGQSVSEVSAQYARPLADYRRRAWAWICRQGRYLTFTCAPPTVIPS
ncbi:MAG: 7TM-DISM domain-containing protein [Thiolinea sp.]